MKLALHVKKKKKKVLITHQGVAKTEYGVEEN